MSLDSFFTEQFDELREFMVSPDEVVRCVRIDSEMESMFNKALAKMEDEPNFPHAFLAHSRRFTEPLEYFAGLYEFLTEEIERSKDDFAEHEVRFDYPDKDDEQLKEPARFLRHAQAVAESLPDSAGSLVFLLDPEQVDDREFYNQSIRFLSAKTKSRWLKFLVLDSRMEPDLPEQFDEDETILTQTFYLGPEEMERRAAEDIDAPGAMYSVQGRQALGLLAGFAYARKDHDSAIELQTKWVEESEKNGEPAESAQAYFNLGNTLLESEAYSDATEALCKACSLCLEHQLDALAPFAYTNLGVSLHRQEAFPEAFDSLRVARDMFRVQRQLPGEIHVVDTLAGMYAIDGNNDKAERTWLYALDLSEGMTSSNFTDARESGSQDIRTKLKRFYQETDQKDKIKALDNRERQEHDPSR